MKYVTVVAGTVTAFQNYHAEDPVSKWFAKEKADPNDPNGIVGEAWDPLYDSEYLYKAMDGLGKIHTTNTRNALY